MLAAFTGDPLPTKQGQEFVLNDWDQVFLPSHLGANHFSGATGVAQPSPGLISSTWSNQSLGSTGGSLALAYSFAGRPASDGFAGYFETLQGAANLPGYSLNLQDFYDGFGVTPRSIELLRFDVLRQSADPITLRVELADAQGRQMFQRISLSAGVGTWQNVSLALAGGFELVGTEPFDFTKAKQVALVIERTNAGLGVVNPDAGSFLVDNLRLEDADGVYPNFSAALTVGGGLQPKFEAAFLDQLRRQAAQYFVDWASTDPRTGGLPQDRSTFGELLTIGGVGFQLSSYILSAERGYLSRGDAALRTRDVLRVLMNQPQGPAASGTIGHNGFFYHFTGLDGLRKQNVDLAGTSENEALNTVELSTIDTTLAIVGALTSSQYFRAANPVEDEIRMLAESIYSRVNWNFMLYRNPSNPADPQNNQFFLGWKPNEPRNLAGRYLLNDALGQGQYSSAAGPLGERPQTLDYYTDEGLLTVLLAMAAPVPAHRVGAEAWYALLREKQGGDFIKSFPGALFTYQFASLWLDTEGLGTDNHPTTPVDFFANTRAATIATRQHAIANPNSRATLSDKLWGLTAAEGAHGGYRAYAAPAAAAAEFVTLPPTDITREAESQTSDTRFRGNASGGLTAHLAAGESLSFVLNLPRTDRFTFPVRYSNDTSGPLETITLLLDGVAIGSFAALDTGDSGFGWNQFVVGNSIPAFTIPAGTHTITLAVSGGDGFGVEIDTLRALGEAKQISLEDGTIAPYGMASALNVLPAESLASLVHVATALNPNARGQAGLYHPRVGLPDTINLQVADLLSANSLTAVALGAVRASGPFVSYVQLAIDAGPLAIALDNQLSERLIPRLFSSRPEIAAVLLQLFPDQQNPWHNRDDPLDVNRDQFITGLDALIVVNFFLLGPFNQPLPQFRPVDEFEVDVNDDGFTTGLDALIVVNQVNLQFNGEGEQASFPRGLKARQAAGELDEELLAMLALSLSQEQRRESFQTDF